MNNVFKYINRGYVDNMVLLPGWACDYRIFDQVDLGFNYLMPEFFYPETILKDLLKELNERGLGNITMLGFSLGGFEGLRFSLKYPQYVNKLILIGVRRRYSIEDMALIKNNLRRNKKACLIQFYKSSFYDQSKMLWFKQNLMRDYCDMLPLDFLLETLDHLAECSITASELRVVDNCTIFHGKNDSIAPAYEMQELCKEANKELTLLENTGHAVFLEQAIAL